MKFKLLLLAAAGLLCIAAMTDVPPAEISWSELSANVRAIIDGKTAVSGWTGADLALIAGTVAGDSADVNTAITTTTTGDLEKVRATVADDSSNWMFKDDFADSLQNAHDPVAALAGVDSGFVADVRPRIKTAASAVTYGQVVYIDADQKVAPGDKDTYSTARPYGMCVEEGGIEAEATGKILTSGTVKYAPWTTVTGDSTSVWLGDDGGVLEAYSSTAGDYLSFIGDVEGEDIISLRPSGEVTEIAE